jgi:pectinesterase
MMNGTAPFGFVDQATRTRSAAALAKGVDCILATQIEVSGKKTGWCAQHHEVTLEPANARAYELASISGSEGAAVLAFLMTLDLARPEMPKQGIIDAVEGAAVFYGSEPIKIVGLQKSNQDTDAGANDLVMVEVPGAGPLWARFYELDPPHRPFFCDRDGVKKYDVAEIGYERRNGYAWYGNWPVGPVRDTYPKWAARWTPGRNVMAPQGMVDAGVDASEPPR